MDLPFPATPENAGRFAALSVEAAFEVGGARLDYSPGSLRAVEDFLGRQAKERKDAVALLFGCYLGEVLVRSGKGRWRSTAGTPMEGFAAVPLVLELGEGDYCDPLGRVRRFCEAGASESLVRFFEAFSPARRPWWRRLFGR